MTITTAMLDSIADCPDETTRTELLQLVAIARAALAWSEASREAAKLRVQWSHTNDDTLLNKIERLDKQIVGERRALDLALRGTPMTIAPKLMSAERLDDIRHWITNEGGVSRDTAVDLLVHIAALNQRVRELEDQAEIERAGRRTAERLLRDYGIDPLAGLP